MSELTPEQKAIAMLAEAVGLLAYRSALHVGTDTSNRVIALTNEVHDLIIGGEQSE